MVVFLLVAGIGLVLAGLAAIGFGIPVKEFSFGNTLIFTGTVAGCTGLVMLGLGMVVRELKTIARRIAPRAPARAAANGSDAASAVQASESDGVTIGRDRPGVERPRQPEPVAPPVAGAPVPWLEEANARERLRQDTSSPSSDPAAKPRRNLMFSSSRRERERAARAADPSTAEPGAGSLAAPPQSEEPPSPDASPQPDGSRIADPLSQRRSNRAPSTFTESAAGAPAAEPSPDESVPAVTVLKSGVVDGMAYSLFSDGSIEAQMPEGMMRFASIDELRAHLDQRS